MSHLRISGAALALVALMACNPKVKTNIVQTYPPTEHTQEVAVLGLQDPEPDGAELIGSLKISDTGFSTNCGYEVIMQRAIMEARKAGGNALKITEHTQPFGSNCPRVRADILRVDPELLDLEENVIPGADYAELNVFRHSGPGFLIGYDLYLGDSVICRVKNNTLTTLHIKKEGLNTLWARTESREEIPIDIELGRKYYLRCSVVTGIAVGRPKLELVPHHFGRTEIETFKTN